MCCVFFPKTQTSAEEATVCVECRIECQCANLNTRFHGYRHIIRLYISIYKVTVDEIVLKRTGDSGQGRYEESALEVHYAFVKTPAVGNVGMVGSVTLPASHAVQLQCASALA